MRDGFNGFARRHSFRPECPRLLVGSIFDLDFGAILQLVKAGDRDGVARVEPLDRRHIAVGGLLDNVLDRGSVVTVHLVDKSLHAVTLNGRTGDQQGVMQCAYQHAGVDELVGVKGEVAIVELRAEANGAGRGVDLVIDGEQMAGGDLVHLRTVEGVDRQGRTAENLRPHLGQVVFRYVKDHGNRLQLCHYGECI